MGNKQYSPPNTGKLNEMEYSQYFQVLIFLNYPQTWELQSKKVASLYEQLQGKSLF